MSVKNGLVGKANPVTKAAVENRDGNKELFGLDFRRYVPMKMGAKRDYIALCSLFIFLFLVGCQDESEQKSFEHTVSIALGKTSYIQERELTIGFTRVLEDSRCPIGAECVWEGNGKVELYARQTESVPQYFELNTTLDPQTETYFNIEITLVGLDPYPSVQQTIDSLESVCTLRIRGL